MISVKGDHVNLGYDNVTQIVGEAASVVHLVSKSVEEDKLLAAETCLSAVIGSAILFMEMDGMHIDLEKLADSIVKNTHVAPLASE